jgi:hypothetical protein
MLNQTDPRLNQTAVNSYREKDLLVALGVKWSSMQDDKNPGSEEATAAASTTDWADLRAQADKLGISLSQFQQLQLEKKIRLAKKAQHNVR